MSRRFLFSLLPAVLWIAPLTAAPSITQVVVEEEAPCVRVSFRVDVRGGNSRVGMYYGFDANPKDELRTARVASPGNPASRTLAICNLPPSAKVYLQPFATDQSDGDEGVLQCVSTCRNCNFGAGATDAHCDAAGEAPYIETAAFDDITPPEAPRHSYDAMEEPTVNGRVFQVNCQNGLATDFMNVVQQAANADSNQWHRVEIPGGCKAKGQFNLPPRSGSGQGGVIITTQADPKLLPPAGVRTDPSYRPVLAKLEAPSDFSWIGGISDRASSWLYSTRGATGYRFQNIEIGLPDFREIPVRTYGVSGVSVNGSNVSISLDAPQGTVQHWQPMLMNMQGCNGLQGYVNAPSPTAQGFNSPNLQVSGQCAGGTATLALAWPLKGCSAGSPVRCDTDGPHGIPNLEALPIDSISRAGNGNLQLNLAAAMHTVEGNSTRYILSDDAVMVEGTGTPLDGTVTAAVSANNNRVVVTGSEGGQPCSGGCGTVREIHPIQVFETNDPSLDGSRHFRVVDEDTIELLGVSAASDVSGGYITYDPPYAIIPISFSYGERIVFDRVLMDCGSFPYRTRTCMNFVAARGMALVNSYIRGASYWLPMDPITLSPKSARDGDRSFTPQVNTVLMNGSQDIQIRNNTIFDAHGIVLFTDTFFNDSADQQARDLTIQRTTVFKPNEFLAGHPESNGRYYQDRHCIETKGTIRMLVEGVRCSGNFADWTPSGPAIVLSPRGHARVDRPVGVSDVTVRGNIIERSASGMQIATETRVGFNSPGTQRVAVEHNIFADIDMYTYRSRISGISGLSPANGFGGYWLTLFNAVGNLSVKNNTVGFQRGRSTETMHLIGSPSSTAQFEDNIINFSQTPSSVFGILREQPDWTPGCGAGRGPSAFKCYFNRAGQADPLSRFDGNVIYPCLKDAASGTRSEVQSRIASPGGSLGAGAAAGYFGQIHTNRPNEYLQGSGARSCADRLNELFEPRTFIPRGPYQGKGADPALVKRYIGEVGEVTATPGPGEVRLQYQAPDEAACTIDVSTETTFVDPQRIVRTTDGGGAIDRDVTVSGLSGGTDYAYRILCAAQQPRGVFRTQ